MVNEIPAETNRELTVPINTPNRAANSLTVNEHGHRQHREKSREQFNG